MAGPEGPRPLIAGRYRLGSRLGRGGMAEVLDAFDERLERAVAVKVLRPEVAADAGMRRRFEAEARSAARFSHPSVVSVYDSGEHAGRAFLVMERLPGETLADRISAGPVDQVWLRTVAFDVLSALGAAHDIGLLHRDIKPGNVLITEENRAKVADFGIAKMMVGQDGPTGDETAVGLVLGTPAYLAPERLSGQAATVATDLFALGVVLYEAATGHKPQPGALDATAAGTDATVVGTRATGAAGAAAAGAVIEPDLARVIRRAMAPRPEDRYPSAAAMAADLRRGGPDLPPTVLAPPTVLGTRVLPAEIPPVVVPIEDADHRRALGIAAAILLVIIAVIVILLLAANTKSPTTPSTTTTAPPTTPVTTIPTTLPPTTPPTTAPPTAPPTTAPPPTTPTTVPTTTTTRPATTTTTTTTTTTLPVPGGGP